MVTSRFALSSAGFVEEGCTARPGYCHSLEHRAWQCCTYVSYKFPVLKRAVQGSGRLMVRRVEIGRRRVQLCRVCDEFRRDCGRLDKQEEHENRRSSVAYAAKNHASHVRFFMVVQVRRRSKLLVRDEKERAVDPLDEPEEPQVERRRQPSAVLHPQNARGRALSVTKR